MRQLVRLNTRGLVGDTNMYFVFTKLVLVGLSGTRSTLYSITMGVGTTQLHGTRVSVFVSTRGTIFVVIACGGDRGVTFFQGYVGLAHIFVQS